MNSEASISQRFVPPVAGVDLEHALNYVSAEALPRAWFYEHFTWPGVFYRRGSRPALETFLEKAGCQSGELTPAALHQIIDTVYTSIAHFSLLGVNGNPGRGLSEEGLLLLGQGWCNEQARVLAALCQVAGFPARLVFCGMPNGRGHVLTEVFCEEKWTLVDQTAAFRFCDDQGRGVHLGELEEASPLRAQLSTTYRAALQAERSKAVDPAFWDEFVPYGVVDDPMDLFYSVGYINYFVH